MNSKIIIVLFAISLTACDPGRVETAALSPVAVSTTEPIIVPSLTRTSSPTKTPTPTVQPTITIPAATLNVIATVEAIRLGLVNQFPELEEYNSFCNPTYCNGVEVSPDGQLISFSNGNVIEILETSGKRVGKYSWYEIYGKYHGYPADYYEGGIKGVHWSKDGQYLYLATAHGDGGPGPYFGYKSSLARINLLNGTWKDTGISGVISFSPNDKFIVYSTNTSEIRVRHLQSGEEKIYLTPEYYQYFGEFAWSPDSKKIIFVATPNDFDDIQSKFALFVIDLESDKTILLYEDLNPFYYPVEWVEDNKISLSKYQEDGKWMLDLSANPPTISP